jgi:3-phenylpropionate/cinnamic acid dioxygenase small subunit
MSEPSDSGQILDVILRYATAIDRREWSLFSSVFTDDAELDYGEVGQWVGADAIKDFMRRAHAGARHTMHRLSNQVIDVDGETAEARTYVDALILVDDGSGANAIGFYDDRMRRTADGWRITRRTYTPVRLVAVNG